MARVMKEKWVKRNKGKSLRWWVDFVIVACMLWLVAFAPFWFVMRYVR